MDSRQGTMVSALGNGRRALADEVLVGYKRTEVGVIPEDWERSSVRAIASSTRNAIVGGPFGSDLVSKDYVAHGVPVIRGQNMSGRWVSGSFVFVTPTKAKSLEANLAYPGDIIFTQRGTLGQVSLVADKPFSTVFAKIGAAIFLERKRLLSQESCIDNNMMAFSLTVPGACEQFFYYLVMLRSP